MLTTIAYLPPLAWFIVARDTGIWRWEAHENYQKGGWRNRCRIATANGPLLLSVPLRGGKHRQMPICEVRIDYATDWPRQHAQTIRSAYGRAPYFEHYGEEILHALHHREELLIDYDRRLTALLLQLLQWPVSLTQTEEFAGGAAGAVSATEREIPPYPQVFTERHGFIGGLSVLDGLFCLGPELATLAM